MYRQKEQVQKSKKFMEEEDPYNEREIKEKWLLLGGQKYMLLHPAVACHQVTDLLLRLQLSTWSRLHLSIAVFDWPKEPWELHCSIWVAQINWFCFLVRPNVCKWVCVCAQTAWNAHTHVTHYKAAYVEKNTTRDARTLTPPNHTSLTQIYNFADSRKHLSCH